MIIDFQRFLINETPYWDKLDEMLNRSEQNVGAEFSIEEAKQFHYLYQRASSDLMRLSGFPNEPRTRSRLEALVARSYAEISETRGRARRCRPSKWLLRVFPSTFRRNASAFRFAAVVMLVGAFFGAFVAFFDPAAKSALVPFEHLHGDPSDRVAYEETSSASRVSSVAPEFSAMLMTHNIRVTIFAMALGITFGAGTILILFYNGVILGAVVCDYVLAGELVFLLGWLLPHGAVEIPAILIGAQAGLVLGRALLGRGDSSPLRMRMRAVTDDLLTLVAGAALLLVWAGIVEAFLSQYHAPVLPYWIKITFGAVELAALVLYLSLAGARKQHA